MEGSKFTTLENGWVTCDIFLDFLKTISLLMLLSVQQSYFTMDMLHILLLE